MINLSQFMRRSPHFTLFEKMRSSLTPDFYLAGDVSDVTENAPFLPFPFIKTIINSRDVAYIAVHNVKISLIPYLNDSNGSKFVFVYDSSGIITMEWPEKNNRIFPPRHSYEEACIEEGIKDGDMVHALFFRYFISSWTAVVLEVQKYPRWRNGARKKYSLKEMLDNLIPGKEPVPQEA